ATDCATLHKCRFDSDLLCGLMQNGTKCGTLKWHSTWHGQMARLTRQKQTMKGNVNARNVMVRDG
ncbi:MAG: hypothetical protein RSB74_03135, partial [Kiritimatiellia bacterium]